MYFLFNLKKNSPHIGIFILKIKAKSNLKNAKTKMFGSSLIKLNKSMGEDLGY
jgi:hypothetical protein